MRIELSDTTCLIYSILQSTSDLNCSTKTNPLGFFFFSFPPLIQMSRIRLTFTTIIVINLFCICTLASSGHSLFESQYGAMQVFSIRWRANIKILKNWMKFFFLVFWEVLWQRKKQKTDVRIVLGNIRLVYDFFKNIFRIGA